MKYNVQANRLGHAIRCVRWDWGEPAPTGINLSNVDFCIGSDLIYYHRSHRDLATSACRASPRVLLLSRLRIAEDDGHGQVVHRSSGEGYKGSSMERFVEEELPEHGLEAVPLHILDKVFEEIQPESAREALWSSEARSSFCLHEVVSARPGHGMLPLMRHVPSSAQQKSASDCVGS